jgi:hypothetical protein
MNKQKSALKSLEKWDTIIKNNEKLCCDDVVNDLAAGSPLN